MSIEAMDYPTGGIHPAVGIDGLPHTYIADLDQQFKRKIFNPSDDTHAHDRLLETRSTWRELGAITVFASGVYDMRHMDHAGFLLHTKASAAAVQYDRERERGAWDLLSPVDQLAYTSLALGERAIRLIVSVDGDASVAKRKGYSIEKGNTIRPIYSWQTRALEVARLTFMNPLDASGESLLPTVDAVTIHGPDDFSPDHPHASLFELAHRIQPDVWTIFSESTDILDVAPSMPELDGIELRCIEDSPGAHYYEDEFVGVLSTTNLVKRITAT